MYSSKQKQKVEVFYTVWQWDIHDMFCAELQSGRQWWVLAVCEWVSVCNQQHVGPGSPRDTAACAVIRKSHRTECAVLIWLKNTLPSSATWEEIRCFNSVAKKKIPLKASRKSGKLFKASFLLKNSMYWCGCKIRQVGRGLGVQIWRPK